MLGHEAFESREELLHKMIVRKERVGKTKESRYKTDIHSPCDLGTGQWQQVGSRHKGQGMQAGLKQMGREDTSATRDQYRRKAIEQHIVLRRAHASA
eukprot:1224584-Pleurochrysis_carterae.AAC.1